MSALARDPHVAFGRFRVLPRTDGRWIVVDPARALGQQTAADAATLAQATTECERLSAEASARGEPNEPERKGFKNDWGDPATWDRLADVPPRPLFPSLLTTTKETDTHGQEEHRNERHHAGERLELELVDELPAAGLRRRGARPARRAAVREGA